MSPKFQDDILDFREDFCLHMVLLKQHLLELSPLAVCHARIQELSIHASSSRQFGQN